MSLVLLFFINVLYYFLFEIWLDNWKKSLPLTARRQGEGYKVMPGLFGQCNAVEL